MGATPTDNALIVGDLNGDPGYTELTPEPGWSRSSGFFTSRHFVGTRDAIQTLANTFASANSGVDAITPSYDGLKGDLVVKIVDSTDFQGLPGKEMPIWECTENALVKPIEAHMAFSTCDPGEMQFARECYEKALSINRLANMNAADIAALPKQFQSAYSTTSMTVVVGPPFVISFLNVSGSKTCNLLDYFKLLWKGTTDYFESGFNLKKTTTVSLRSALVALYVGVNRVVAGGITTIAPPTALLGDLKRLPLISGSTGEWEVLKRCPQVRSQAKGRYEVVYEYWLAEKWSKILYGGTAIP